MVGGVFFMVITNIKSEKMDNIPLITEEELQNEFDYIIAEKLTIGLLDSGLINEEQSEQIMDLNKQKFKPLLYRI